MSVNYLGMLREETAGFVSSVSPSLAHANMHFEERDQKNNEKYTYTTTDKTDRTHTVLDAWLALIGEDDPAIRAAFWAQVERDPEARAYFLGHANDSLNNEGKP